MFAVGTLIAGKFRVDRVLGKGGMGVVVAATHVQLNQRVALKLLSPDDAKLPHVVERFTREARAAAALRGEHVCRVTDVGELPDFTPYIVMELLEGIDLSRMLSTNGPLPVARACNYVLQACIGVAEAHAAGIVHRDLKPANLFVAQRPDGTSIVKVLDFGIAKAPDSEADFSLTRTAAVLGSPGYMSPEQLRSSRDVDLRTDIWSLGVILFELVTGKRPFTATSITELAIKVTVDQRPPIVVPMPHGFDQIIDCCLSKEPRDRYPDLAALAQALAPFAGAEGWDYANAVARMLRAPSARPTPMPGVGGPPIAGEVPPTVVGTSHELPPTVVPTPPMMSPSHGYSAPGYSSSGYPSSGYDEPPPQTTLGSSVGSREVLPPARASRRLLAGIAAAGIATALTIVVFLAVRRTSGQDRGKELIELRAQPAPDTAASSSTTDAEARVTIDAEQAAPATPDAAEVIAPPADAATVQAPADAAAVPGDAPVKKRVINTKKKDFGDSRI